MKSNCCDIPEKIQKTKHKRQKLNFASASVYNLIRFACLDTN